MHRIFNSIIFVTEIAITGHVGTDHIKGHDHSGTEYVYSVTCST